MAKTLYTWKETQRKMTAAGPVEIEVKKTGIKPTPGAREVKVKGQPRPQTAEQIRELERKLASDEEREAEAQAQAEERRAAIEKHKAEIAKRNAERANELKGQAPSPPAPPEDDQATPPPAADPKPKTKPAPKKAGKK